MELDPNSTITLSCDDSPLSTTGSIVGILTFAYALAIGFQFYVQAMKNASEEAMEMTSSLTGQVRSADRKYFKLRDSLDAAEVDGILVNADGERLRDEAQNAVSEAVKTLTITKDYLRNIVPDSFTTGRFGFRWRAKFISTRNEIKAQLERVNQAMARLRDVTDHLERRLEDETESVMEQITNLQAQQTADSEILRDIAQRIGGPRSRRLSF